MIQELHHACIICSNYDRAKEFYADILGFHIYRESYSELHKRHKLELHLHGRYMLEIFIMKDVEEDHRTAISSGLNHISFLVDNVREMIAYLQAKGVKTSEVKMDSITRKEYAFFYDPDKLKLEIYSS